MMDPC